MNASRLRFSCVAAAILSAVSLSTARANLLSVGFETQLETWLGEGNLTFTNVYTRSAGDTSVNFHSAVDLKGPTFALFEGRVAGSGNAFETIGGYNPQSWDASIGYVLTPNLPDRTAFLYNLSGGVVYHQRLDISAGQYQTNNFSSTGPSFGGGTDLDVDGSLLAGHMNSYSYEWSPYPVGAGPYTPLEYGAMEVFTYASVPEPSSCVLVVLVVAGCPTLRTLRRRPL